MLEKLWKLRHALIGASAIGAVLFAGAGVFAPEHRTGLFLAAALAGACTIAAAAGGGAARSVLRGWRNHANPKAAAPEVHAATSAGNQTVSNLDTAEDRAAGEALLTRALENAAAAMTAAPGRVIASPATTANGPQVAVVIPMFNEERFIAAAIDSLKRQSFEDFEAIIVDDGSTDGSMSAAMAAAKDDARFRFARHAANAGLSAARNTGLRLARAPYIAFLDSDDFFFPDALAVRVDAMRALEGENARRAFAGVYCRLITMPQSITLDEALRRLPNRTVKTEIVDFVSSGGECPFNAHAPMLYTDIVRTHGGFDETLRHGCEDWDLWQRIMRNGYAFAPTNRLSGVYRRKRGSMVKETPREHLETARGLFDRARRPVAQEDVSKGAPFVFTESVQHYQDRLRFIRRTAQFAAINAFASADALEAVVADAPQGAAAYLDDARDLTPFIEAGVRRTIALDEPSIEAMRDKFDLLVKKVLHLLQARASLPEPSAESRAPVFDAVFFAQTQAQVKAMAPAARALGAAGNRVLFVTTETETGDQGQRAALAAENLPFLTFNRACLMKILARAAAIMRPYSSLIRDCIPDGAAIIEIDDPAAPVSAPDENAPREDARVCAPEAAAEALAALIGGQGEAFAIGENARKTGAGYAPASVVISKEESFNQVPDYADLLAMKDKWRGERCVIIGNGPSINQTDLTKLKNEFTFAVNGIFYKSAEMGFDPTFYVVEDSAVMKENIDAIKAYRGHYKLFPTLYRDLHPKDDNVAFFMMNRGFYEKESPQYCIPRFSTDAARRVYCGQSVTHINLQLAYYFGFSEVYLIGVDFSYVIPDTAIRKGDLIISTEDDQNHFHGDYFGKGKTWKDPKLHRVKLNYELARDMFAADGRKVFNATKGGALEVFERAEYDVVFK
jgi:GT2 family glycosyltransferase